MSKYVSWKKIDNNVFFLQDSDLQGKKFDKYKRINNRWKRDICGHEAIEYFYPELLTEKGTNEECVNFLTPENFPVEIALAIKSGKMTQFGVCPVELLNLAARLKYLEVQEKTYTKYAEIRNIVHLKCGKACVAAREKCDEVCNIETNKYKKIVLENIECVDYKNICDTTRVAREKICIAAKTEYTKAYNLAGVEHNNARNTAWDERDKVCETKFWNLFQDDKNRNAKWK